MFLLSCVHLSAQSNEEAEVKLTTNKFYNVLSFSDTNGTKLDSLPFLFTKDGKLVAAYGNELTSWTTSEFVSLIRKTIPTQQIIGRLEKEISHKTEIFGNIAHAFSTYELTVQSMGQQITRRGINSIQLVKENGNWYIISLTWDREWDARKLPSKYLQN